VICDSVRVRLDPTGLTCGKKSCLSELSSFAVLDTETLEEVARSLDEISVSLGISEIPLNPSLAEIKEQLKNIVDDGLDGLRKNLLVILRKLLGEELPELGSSLGEILDLIEREITEISKVAEKKAQT